MLISIRRLGEDKLIINGVNRIVNLKLNLVKAILILLAFAIFMVSGAEALTSYTNTLGGSYSSSQVQTYQPTIYNTYSQSEISQYWPIISKSDVRQCVGRQDFVVQISPGGCTPMVVRSDLLEEQNVPVFCKLDAVKLNPLIDVSAIDRINPTLVGKYPAEIAGIGYHPARAALRTYDKLLGSPTINNIGYLVVVLKQQPVEKNMPDWVEANLNAYLQYDLTNSWGVGRTEYYLPIMDEALWQRDYKEYGFWRGKGYLRTDWIEGDKAQVSVWLDSGQKIATKVLQKGQTSDDIYLPGFYCLAGMQLNLAEIDVPKVSARLQVDDDVIDVRAGSKFKDNCYVNSIESYGGGTGSVTITCGEKAVLSLDFSEVEFDISSSGSVERKKFKMPEEVIGGKNKYYLVYSAELPSSVTFDGDRKFVVFLNTSESADAVAKKYPDIKKKVYDYLKSVGNKNQATTLESFASGLPKNYGNLVLLASGKSIEDGDKKVEIAGFSFYDRQYADKTNGAGDKIEGYYSSAVQSYKDLAAQFPSETLDSGESYGERALSDAAGLSGAIEKTARQRELLQELVKEYPNSKTAGDAQNQLDNSAVFKTENSQHIFSKTSTAVNVRLISISEPSKEDASAEIFYTGYSSTGRVNSNPMTLMENDYVYRNNTDYIKLKSINSDSIVVDYSCMAKNDKGELGRVTNSNLKIYERGSKESSIASFCDFSIEVNKINLKQVAKVVVIPKTIGTQSAVNFTFKIGIEKRGIQLSTEKTKEMIDNLNKTIKSWENINEKLGVAVEGLKGACFATSAILNIKNLISNFGGAGTARSMIMRGEGGWMTACESAVSSGVLKVGGSVIKQASYSSVDDCLQDNNDAIEKSVSYLSNKISDENAKIKSMQSDITTTGLFGDSSVDSAKLAEREMQMVQNYKSSSLQVGTGANKIEVGSVLSKLNDKNKNVLSIDDMRSIDMNMNILQDSSAPSDVQARANSQLYSILNNAKNQMNLIDPGGLNEKTGHTFDSYQDKNSFNAIYRGEVASTKDAYAFEIAQGTPVSTFSYNGKNYIATLEKLDSSHYTPSQFNEVDSNGAGNPGTTYKKGSPEFEKLAKTFGSFTKVDGSSYKNLFKTTPKVKYWESGSYKGIPAFVPVDVQEGWYAATKQTVSSFGGLKTADESGRITSFWLCNIGTNGIAEFETVGDDICQMVNLQTGQPLDSFPGLSKEKASALVTKTGKLLQEAAAKYQAGVKRVSLSSGNFEVGEPASGQLGTRCQDFMSPQDCWILFNVCDPVICPSSRCNLGGSYYVDDVVQSGIIGSIALCLPNIKEKIFVPVCLTGIHAGLEGYLSILKAHRDCLQESLNSGQHVGICDEIYSIYLCEFFWRELGPILNMLIPKMIETAYGQGARGGGEYLTVMDSWNNMQKSVDYFTGYYANNAVKAFRIRSTQDVGGEVCKAFVSVSTPNSLKLLLEPESPVQFSAWFSETSYTTATVPATSQYKVFYHIYAGQDIGTYFTVYLKDPPGTSYYQSNPIITVATGFIPRGGYADETRDFTAPSGYQQLCVRVNDKDECGFKQVSTDFALNYIQEKYVSSQATESITSEQTCISGSASAYALINPNIQAGAEEAAMPSIYNRGLIRICATANPGQSTEPGRWKDVGYCDDQKIRCWLDQNSVENLIKNKDILNQTISNISQMSVENLFGMNYSQKVDETGSLITNLQTRKAQFEEKYTKISLTSGNIGVMDAEINNLVSGSGNANGSGIDAAISGAVMNSQKARLLYMKAKIYDFAARKVHEAFFRGSVSSGVCAEGLGVCRDKCLSGEDSSYSDCTGSKLCCVKKSSSENLVGKQECDGENTFYDEQAPLKNEGAVIRDNSGSYWVKKNEIWNPSDKDGLISYGELNSFESLATPVCLVKTGEETSTPSTPTPAVSPAISPAVSDVYSLMNNNGEYNILKNEVSSDLYIINKKLVLKVGAFSTMYIWTWGTTTILGDVDNEGVIKLGTAQAVIDAKRMFSDVGKLEGARVDFLEKTIQLKG